MFLFSRFKITKKVAKEHKSKNSEKETQSNNNDAVRNAKVPYRHISKHAGIDALNGAPTSWRFEIKANTRSVHSKRGQQVPPGNGTAPRSWGVEKCLQSSSCNIPGTSRSKSTDPAIGDQGCAIYLIEPDSRHRRLQRSHSMTNSQPGSNDSIPLASNTISRGTSLLFSFHQSRFTYDSSDTTLPQSTASSISSEIADAESKNSVGPQPTMLYKKPTLEKSHWSKSHEMGKLPFLDSTQLVIPKPVLEEVTGAPWKTKIRRIVKGKSQKPVFPSVL
jgi:hypothetical protein